MDTKEGLNRIAVVLRIIGWIALGVTGLMLIAGLIGRWSSIGDGVFLLPILSGISFGAAYILKGFAGVREK